MSDSKTDEILISISRNLNKFTVAAIILMQLAVMILAGTQRVDFHIDEIYSYVIANSSQAPTLGEATWLQGNWVSGEKFVDLLEVQPGEQLDFTAAYDNTAQDAHPPMYYWLLHAASAIAPSTFTHWTGVGLNIAVFVASGVLLYLISRQLIASRLLVYVPLVIWGFSSYAIISCEFIRMYMLITFFALAFIYINIYIERRGISVVKVLLAFLAIFLGSLSHYYFAVFAFWVVLISVLRMLVRRDIRSVLVYGFSSLMAVVLMVAVFPYAITQATGSTTNNIGNEVTRSLFDFSLWTEKSVDLAKQCATGLTFLRPVSLIAVLGLVLVVCASLIKLWKQRNAAGDNAENQGSDASSRPTVWWLVAAFFLTFFSISKIGGEYVYLRYVHFILPIVIVWAIAVVERAFGSYRSLSVALVACCGLVSAINVATVYLQPSSTYTFNHSRPAALASLAKEDSTPLVFLNIGTSATRLTSNLTTVALFDSVYVDDYRNIIDGEVVSECLDFSGSCVLFVPITSTWGEGLDPDVVFEELSNDEPDLSVKELWHRELGNFYYVTTEAERVS